MSNQLKFIAGLLIALMTWDVLTTYYGIISFFSPTNGEVIEKIKSANMFVHITAMLCALGVMAIIMLHKSLWGSGQTIKRGVLIVAMLYDFLTAWNGTAQATNFEQGNAPQFLTITLIALLCTASPILFTHLGEITAE